MNAWNRSHSSLGARAPIPVFRTTSRATRSGFSTAKRKPIGPPQSCTTTVASRRSSSAANRAIDVVVPFVRVPTRARWACRSARSRNSPVRCSAPPARASGSPCGRGTPTSARRAGAAPGRRCPRRRSASAARPARRSAARSRSRAGARSVRRVCGRRRSILRRSSLLRRRLEHDALRRVVRQLALHVRAHGLLDADVLPSRSERNQRCSSTWWNSSAAAAGPAAPPERRPPSARTPPAATSRRPPTRRAGASRRSTPRGSARCRSASAGPGSPARPGRSAAAAGDGGAPARRRAGRAEAVAAAVASSWISSTSKPSSLSRCSRSSTLNRSSGRERLLARQLAPEDVVAPHDLVAGLVGVEVRRKPDLGVDVEQLADDVDLRDLEVVGALTVGERAVELTRLGVDEVGGQRAGVAPEERVRERAVTPEEAAQMQPGEQLGERVQEMRAQIRDATRPRRASGRAARTRGGA